MSCRKSQSNSAQRRVNNRKSRKLTLVETSVDEDYDFYSSPVFQSREQDVVVDLFGTPIIQKAKCVSNSTPKTKRNKKTPIPRKEKQSPQKCLINTPINEPKKPFIVTPQMVQNMKDAREELNTIMGLDTSTIKIPTISNDSSPNVSGVQQLPNSPKPSAMNETITKPTVDENNKKSLGFEGVYAFVDYKKPTTNRGITNELTKLGAKVQKTFNRKVTHVVFGNGSRTTYKKAIERNIPMVSIRWVHYCTVAKEVLDPVKYPPEDIHKYAVKPIRPFSLKNRKNYRKIDYERDRQAKERSIEIYKKWMNFDFYKNAETEIIRNPQNTKQNEQGKINDECDTDSSSDSDMEIVNSPIEKDLKKMLIKFLKSSCYIMQVADEDKYIDERYVPPTFQKLREFLTPNGRDNISIEELKNSIMVVEDSLKLHLNARQRLRKILFPLEKDLHNVNMDNNSYSYDIPSCLSSSSSKKLSSSTPAENTRSKKRKLVYDQDEKIPSDKPPNKMEKNTIKNEKCVIQTSEKANLQTVEKSVKLKSIACTGLTKSETDEIKLAIEKLGSFVFHTDVELSTNYVVTKSQPKRTLNFISAMAFGCYIVSEEWVLESFKINKWLPHKQYLITDLCSKVKEYQICRQTLGRVKWISLRIFNKAGYIYISDTCESHEKLKEIVKSCSGQVTNFLCVAKIIVGYTPEMKDNIDEKWILDCVSQGILLDTNQYRLVVNNMT